MRIIKPLLLCVLLLIAITSQAKEWRGIVPLHSTRADVDRLLGKPNANYNRYEFGNEQADILYSDDPCTAGLQGMWNVPRDTVISIRVTPKQRLRLPDLRLELSKYERVRDPLVQTHTYYTNKEEGLRYEVFEGGGEDDGLSLHIYYEPAAKDANLRCPDAARQQPCKR